MILDLRRTTRVMHRTRGAGFPASLRRLATFVARSAASPSGFVLLLARFFPGASFGSVLGRLLVAPEAKR